MLRGKYLEARASESRRADGREALALELMLLRIAWTNLVTGGVTLDIVEIGDATEGWIGVDNSCSECCNLLNGSGGLRVLRKEELQELTQDLDPREDRE